MTTTNAQPAAPQLVTPEEAGRILALSRVRIYELMAAGQLKSVKIGRSRRISTRALDEFITALEAV